MSRIRNTLIAVLIFMGLIILSPFILLVVLVNKIIYKKEDDRTKGISVIRSRLTNKIISITKMSDKDMESKLNPTILIECIKLFKGNYKAKRFNLKSFCVYDRKDKIKPIKASNANLLRKATIMIKEVWKACKKSGNDHYIIISNGTDELGLQFHNDCGIWISATFRGQERFLDNIKIRIFI